MKAVLKTMVRFNYDKEAEHLQRTYDNILTMLEKSIPEIWIDEPGRDEDFTPVNCHYTETILYPSLPICNKLVSYPLSNYCLL